MVQKSRHPVRCAGWYSDLCFSLLKVMFFFSPQIWVYAPKNVFCRFRCGTELRPINSHQDNLYKFCCFMHPMHFVMPKSCFTRRLCLHLTSFCPSKYFPTKSNNRPSGYVNLRFLQWKKIPTIIIQKKEIHTQLKNSMVWERWIYMLENTFCPWISIFVHCFAGLLLHQ